MKFVIPIFAFSIILLIVGLGVSYVKLADVNARLIVHFDQYRGIDFLGSKADVYGMLIAGIAVVLLNLGIALSFYRKDRFITLAAASTSVVVAVLIFIAALAIIANN